MRYEACGWGTPWRRRRSSGADMPQRLVLAAAELDEERLQSITRQFCQSLSAQLGYDARLPEAPGAAGERGDPVTIGTILVTLAKTGTILGFLRLVQSYIARAPSLELSIVRQDGSRFTLKAANLTERQLRSTEETLERLWNAPSSHG